MDKKVEIKNDIWNICQILITAKDSFQYSFYLHKPDTEEEQDYLNHSPDFIFIRHILWRMCIIEFSKLFSNSKDRDRFNILHFIKKLKKTEYFGDMRFSEAIIADWENQIEINKDTISQVLTLRDKVYGHTDPKIENFINIELSFQQTDKLIQIIEMVIQEIYFTVFDAHAIIDTPTFDRKRFNIITILANEKESEMNGLIADFIKLG